MRREQLGRIPRLAPADWHGTRPCMNGTTFPRLTIRIFEHKQVLVNNRLKWNVYEHDTPKQNLGSKLFCLLVKARSIKLG
jgi:hypothetical protein